MAWLKIDDGFVEHERVDPLSDRAFRLHVGALCLCARKLTDGKLTEKDVRIVAVQTGSNARHIRELEVTGLWVSNNGSGGYEIRDYLDYNPPAEKVKQERREAAERMRHLRNGGNR